MIAALLCEILLRPLPQSASPRIGKINMAIADPAHCADDGEAAKTRSRPNGLLSLPPKRLTIAVVVLAIGLAGCARNPAHREFSLAQREVRPTHVRSPSRANIRAETRREPTQEAKQATKLQPAELHVRRPDAALLTPQPAPNCEFKRADIKTAVDPDEWALLKTEFERQCYQDAEKAARDRLSQLQASSTCEVERVPAAAPRSVTNAPPR